MVQHIPFSGILVGIVRRSKALLRNEHELDAGAGRGYDETEGMADIAGAGFIVKRNPLRILTQREVGARIHLRSGTEALL